MTKMKSKKMTKSTFAIIIMAIVMVAMLAFGGTYAYFTAQAGAKQANIKMGKVSLKSSGTFSVTAEKVVPGDTIINSKITYTNESTVATYVAVRFGALYTGYVYCADGVADTEAYKAKLTNDQAKYPDVTVYKYNEYGLKLDANNKTEAEVKAEDEDATFTAATAGLLVHVTDLPLNGTQVNEAFVNEDGDGLQEIIDSDVWVAGTADTEYANIYMLKGTSNLAVAARTEGDSATYQAPVFIDASEKEIVFDTERHLVEGEWSIGKMVEDEEHEGKMIWKTEFVDGDLLWEDADVTVSIEAYSIQARNLEYDSNGATEGGEKTVTATEAADANGVKNVWDAMKVLLNIA